MRDITGSTPRRFDDLPPPSHFNLANNKDYDPDIVETFVEHGASFLKRSDLSNSFGNEDGTADVDESSNAPHGRDNLYRGDVGFTLTHGHVRGTYGYGAKIGLGKKLRGGKNDKRTLAHEDSAVVMSMEEGENSVAMSISTPPSNIPTPTPASPELPAPHPQDSLASHSPKEPPPPGPAQKREPRSTALLLARNPTRMTAEERSLVRQERIRMAAERKRIFAEEREEEAAREAERMALELERRAEAEGDGDGWRYDLKILADPKRKILCCPKIIAKTKVTYGEHIEINQFAELFSGSFPMVIIDTSKDEVDWRVYRHLYSVNRLSQGGAWSGNRLFGVTWEKEVEGENDGMGDIYEDEMDRPMNVEIHEIEGGGKGKLEVVALVDVTNGELVGKREGALIRAGVLCCEFQCRNHKEYVYEISKLFYRRGLEAEGGVGEAVEDADQGGVPGGDERKAVEALEWKPDEEIIDV